MSPLLTIFVVVSLGSLVGSIPLGPLRLGAAGALFVGLAIGALDPRLGEGLKLVQSIGLALFVYAVGLTAGTTFFREIKRYLAFMGVTVVGLSVVAVIIYFVGPYFGLSKEMTLGTYAGLMTSTPALSAATTVTGSVEPGVGYALAYPIGTVMALLFISWTLRRKWPEHKDTPSLSGKGLYATSVAVQGDFEADGVPGLTNGDIRISYLSRDGKTRVYRHGEALKDGDWLVAVGAHSSVARAIEVIGEETEEHLADKRHEVDHLRFVVSSKAVIGRTIGFLDMPGRFDGAIIRVRRGDLDLLARDTLVLEPGDRVLAVVPADRLEEVRKFIGDSEKGVGEFDPITVGIGLGLGLLLGLVSIPLGGGATLALGAAAGPLLVGMILGHFERTGPLLWQIPYGSNLTIRQLGLLLFLACAGLASGPNFASQAFSPLGVKVIVIGGVLCAIGCGLFLLLARFLGLSAQRVAGGLAGFIGQPALVAAANYQCSDERIDDGYATHYALSIVTKVLLIYGLAAVL
ncbi:MAG: TrkA C-terminal domain-containing protein [Buchananella hordeovulneris]|nr:TrkA C-terminal domain-containing protein [Buchananella hordeovulneris]